VAQAIEHPILRLFGLVREALARATYALLNGDTDLAQAVIDGDLEIDEATEELELDVWSHIEAGDHSISDLRALVGILLILPELERSADLAEHIAHRALANIGAEMTPVARGIVQRMSEVAAEMWQLVAAAYSNHDARNLELAEEDEELDILHGRLTSEIEKADMPTNVVAQMTLISRFYERIGDHAVNLSRRIAAFEE
jgi:phosphate transport system protein